MTSCELSNAVINFHALRYTFITNLIKAGEHPAAVQRMARHSDINLAFRVYADLGLEDLYHGALRGPAVTSSTVGQEAPRKRSTNGAKKNLDGNGDESPTGAESVALNVALPGVPEQRELTSNVTDKTISKEPTQSPERRKPRSKTQRATGVDATCRPLSQNDPAEREGFEPSVPLRARRFSRPVHSTALPSLRAEFIVPVDLLTSYRPFVGRVVTGFVGISHPPSCQTSQQQRRGVAVLGHRSRWWVSLPFRQR